MIMETVHLTIRPKGQVTIPRSGDLELAKKLTATLQTQKVAGCVGY
jgi:hypothetical protein